jgi:hypothetical protein
MRGLEPPALAFASRERVAIFWIEAWNSFSSERATKGECEFAEVALMIMSATGVARSDEWNGVSLGRRSPSTFSGRADFACACSDGVKGRRL